MNKYNERYKILFKKEPPVPWTNFFGIMTAWNEFFLTEDYDKEEEINEEIKFTYSSSKDYTKLIKHIINYNLYK